MYTCREAYIYGYKNRKVFLRIWDRVENPIGVVQIVHGMAEHSLRYEDFASFLNTKGFVVYADDHRGHGYSIGEDQPPGYVGKDGFNSIVEDEKIITEIIRDKCPNIPLFVLGHSFGSFLTQEYIQRYSTSVDGIIFSGSAKQDGLDISFGYIFSWLGRRFSNDKKEFHFIDKLSFGSFNERVDNPKTKFDWISRDDSQVETYINDPLCGFVSPINFFYEMFKGLKGLYKDERLNKINKALPILVLSGNMDPVGKYGKSVTRLYNQYKDLEIQDLSLKLFDGGRHELLNEINKEEVYEFILGWLDERLKGGSNH